MGSLPLDTSTRGVHGTLTLLGMRVSMAILCGHILVSASPRDSTEKVIAGVFPERYQLAESLRTAMPNGDSIILRQLARLNTKTAYDQVLEARRKIQRSGVNCIIGDYHPSYVSAAEKVGVPYLLTSLREDGATSSTFYVLPRPSEISKAIQDLMYSYTWQRVGVIYAETLDQTFINFFIENFEPDLKFVKLPLSAGEKEIRQVLLSLRKKVEAVIVLTGTPYTRRILNKARQLGMISVPNYWILLNLGYEDIYTDILEDLDTNITTINLVTNVTSYVMNATHQVAPHDPLIRAAFSDALASVGETITLTSAANLTEKLTRVTVRGATGLVGFDEYGHRANLTLLTYSSKDEFQTPQNVGALANTKTLEIINAIVGAKRLLSLEGRKNVQVVTILEKPFTMLKDDASKYSGNDRFYGYTVDLMNEVSSRMGFQFELYVVHDGNFGVLMDNGEWNGIIGEILAGNATMSLAPLSINAARELAIDFTNPFKTRAITVLMRTPESQSSYFQFMKPLSDEVWVCTLLTMALITVILFAYEKYSLACRRDMPRLNLRESLWFIFGSLVQGSTESAPVTIPGRILTSAWWFFSLILISTYTANLAAFLTVKKINPPISSVTDLADQITISFGTVRNSGVEMFFKNTNIEPFRKMWTQMSSSDIFPGAMVDSTEEGLKKVKEGNYAFLWDNSVTSYLSSVDCSVTEIGPSFDPKGFGIAVVPGAKYRDALSIALLKLSDAGKLIELDYKWWGQSNCTDHNKPSTDETSELQIENVAGMFFVLLGGIALGALAFGVERLLRKTKCFYKNQSSRPTKNMDESKI